MYAGRIAPSSATRAQDGAAGKTPTGREYDAWVINDMQVGTLGAVMQAGSVSKTLADRFPGLWEDGAKGRLRCHAMIKENEEDGVWGSCLQPSQGLFWYRLATAIAVGHLRRHNDWITDFCNPIPSASRASAC